MTRTVFKKIQEFFLLFLALIPVMFCLSACPGPNSSASPTVSQITITPDFFNVAKGGTLGFSAVVSGTGNPAQTVTWSLEGTHHPETAIGADGALKVSASETALILTVKATSTEDPTKSAEAEVTVGSYRAYSPSPGDFRVVSGYTSYQKKDGVDEWIIPSGAEIVVAFKWGAIQTCRDEWNKHDGGFAKARFITTSDKNINGAEASKVILTATSPEGKCKIVWASGSFRAAPNVTNQWQVEYGSDIHIGLQEGYSAIACINGWRYDTSDEYGEYVCQEEGYKMTGNYSDIEDVFVWE